MSEEQYNKEFLRCCLRSVIVDGVMSAVESDGEFILGDYGTLWDKANEIADVLLTGKGPQIGGPDAPYASVLWAAK